MRGATSGARWTTWVVPVAILVPWLALLTAWQAALFPRIGPLPPQPPLTIVAIAVGAAVLLRLIAPALATHVIALAASTCGIALLAAQIGLPLANATADYCGDFCRTAIMGRFLTFFGWPIVTAGVMLVTARFDRAELAAWTRPWAIVTLVTGLVAAVAWWRTILPNG